jgi:hypothetical protein
MRFFSYIENAVFRYYLAFIIFVLLLFKRKIPKEMRSEFAKMVEEVRSTPITPPDRRI